VEIIISISQTAFYYRRAVAWAWVPAIYLPQATALLVLSLDLRRRDRSLRWKEVPEPASGCFMHNLELN